MADPCGNEYIYLPLPMYAKLLLFQELLLPTLFFAPEQFLGFCHFDMF